MQLKISRGEAKDQMEAYFSWCGAADLSVPLEVSVGYGRTWDDAAH